MGKFKARYEIWKRWKDCNTNTWIYKRLVLFGVVRSITFDLFVEMMEFESKMTSAFDAIGSAVGKLEKKAGDYGVTVDDLADAIRKGK